MAAFSPRKDLVKNYRAPDSLFDLLTGRELIKAQKAEAAENLGILRDGGAREL